MMKAQRARHEPPVFVDLGALLSSVSDEALLSDPALAALLVEHACWDAHLGDWHGRQPSKRNPGYQGWIAEGRTLFDRRDGLKRLAYAALRS